MSILDDTSIAASLVASQSAPPPERARLEHDVVVYFLPMTHALARRYDHRGLELDDLEQVADLALVKALRRFDPAAGHLRGYVTASVLGEIKRHFRDLGWSVRPPRHIQDLQPVVVGAMSGEDEGSPGRSRRAQVADALGIDEATVCEVLSARANFRSLSLDHTRPDGSPCLAALLPTQEEDAFVESDRRSQLRSLFTVLDVSDRELLRMRFVEELSQQEIAARTDSTQKQVSRALDRIMRSLRHRATTRQAA